MTTKITVFAIFRQKWPKIRKMSWSQKNVKFWCFWGSFLNFFDFKRLGHFWLIFRSQFLFFRFLGVKELKTKNFQKCNFLVLNRQIFHICEIFQILNFWPPKVKKTKIGLEKSAKNDPNAQNQKNSWKSPKNIRTIHFFWLYIIFLILGHFFLKMAKTVIFIVIFSNI